MIIDPRGYEFIIQEEAKGFRNKIRFHHEVKFIKRHPDGIYRVTTSSWARFYAKHVLVTLALAFYYRIVFQLFSVWFYWNRYFVFLAFFLFFHDINMRYYRKEYSTLS